MKIKRDKAIKRRMTILSNTFGFKKPYKILCDGNFLQVRHSDAVPVLFGPLG
jgi:hypothetical protein